MNTIRASIIAAAFFASSVFAQNTDNVIRISTGSPAGTYTSFFKSIQARCGDTLQLIEVPSTGSDDNIDNLINRKADAAFLQTDTLQFTALNDPRAGKEIFESFCPCIPKKCMW